MAGKLSGKKVKKKIRKEELAAAVEYVYLERLKQAVSEENKKKVRAIVRRLGRIESRLNKYHGKAVKALEDFQSGEFGKKVWDSRMDALQTRINVFANDVLKGLSKKVGTLPRLVKVKDIDWEQVRQEVIRLERDIQGWEALDRELLKEGLDVMENNAGMLRREDQVAVTSPERLALLLKGEGQYSTYAWYERRTLWNRAVKSIGLKLIRNTTLSNLTLQEFDFDGFRFENVKMEKLDLSGSDMIGCKFSKVEMSAPINFTKVNMTGCEFNNVTRYQYAGPISFRGAYLKGAIFINCHLPDSDFSGCDLNKSKFDSIGRFSRNNFERANFEGADLSRAKIWGTEFGWGHFKDAFLVESIIRDAVFYMANFQGADFSRADLEEVNFNFAQLTNTKFTGAVGQKVMFNVGNGDFQGAHFDFEAGDPDLTKKLNELRSWPVGKTIVFPKWLDKVA